MDAINASRLLPSHFAPLFSPPYRNPSLPPFSRTLRIRIQRFASKSPKLRPNFPLIGYNFVVFSYVEAHRSSPCSKRVVKDELAASTILHSPEPEGRLIKCIAKQIVLALFCFAIGFAPVRVLRVRAVAAPAAEVLDKKEKELKLRGNEYSDCTRRLLETVSFLLRTVEEARKGSGDVEQVEAAWKAVKAKKEELQEGIMNGLYAELRELKREKQGLEKRSEEIVDQVVKTKNEYDKSLRNMGKKVKGGDKTARLEESLRRLEQEYNQIWERLGEIEDRIYMRETAALSFGVRELCFIERECEQLVQNFTREMRLKRTERYK